MTIAPVSKQRKFWILIALFFLVVPNIYVASSVQKSRGGDFRGFLIAGERFINGEFLYAGSSVGTNVTWPPFFAMFIAPFTALAKVNLPLAQVVWYLLNTVMFFIAVGIWASLLLRKPFGWFNGSAEVSLYSMAVFLPVVLTVGPFVDNVLALQISTMLLFLMTLGISDIHHRRPLRAGFWFGLAAAIKAFPVLIIIYLLFRKEIKAAVSMVATGGLLTLLPVLRYGINGYLENIQAWIGLSLAGGYPLGGLNQSFYAMVGRWLALDPFVLMVTRLPTPPLDAPGIVAATWVHRLALLGFIGVIAFMAHRKKYRSIGLETAFFIVLMTIFSPISWRHYYVLMLPATMVITIWWLDRKDTFLKWATIGSGCLISGLYIVGTFGKPIRSFLINVVSNFTLGALLLLTALLYCIGKGYGNRTGSEAGPGKAADPL